MTISEWVIIATIVILSTGLHFLQWKSIKKLQEKYHKIFESNDIEDIDSLIELFAEKFHNIEKNQKKIFTEIDKHAKILSQSLQHITLYRFNPFKDMGGDNSFVLVLLDAQMNGVLLTALTMRDTCRIYAKELNAGKSLIPLHSEEQRILQEVLNDFKKKNT
jgi:hypothetical protein